MPKKSFSSIISPAFDLLFFHCAKNLHEIDVFADDFLVNLKAKRKISLINFKGLVADKDFHEHCKKVLDLVIFDLVDDIG
jgi:hypothetical protein